MQDFDALRHRVEETAERLSSAQSERQQEIQSLIATLSDLEEKYSAQEKQFAYYRARLEPLERSNSQLTALIENLLDLIDRGFGESSLDPLRRASSMASVLLERDLPPVENGSPELLAAQGPGSVDAEAQSEPEPEMDPVSVAVQQVETEPEADSETETGSFSAEPEMAVLDDVEMDENADVLETAEEASSDPVANAEEVGAEPAVAETAGDLVGSEEDVQIVQDLVELIEDEARAPDASVRATEEVAVEATGSDEQDEVGADGVADLELEEVPLTNLKDDIEMALDDMPVDLDVVADSSAAEAWDESARFEDVSEAVLDLELEEDASNALDELPRVVKSAAAAFASGSTADDVDTLEAIAEAMEKETGSSPAAAPAHSDIRSLMLRVEALAKKAEAMRLAQAGEPSASSGASGAEDSAASEGENPKKPGVAA